MPTPRTGKALILATKPFEKESVVRSWYEIAITFAVYGSGVYVIARGGSWAWQLALATFIGAVGFRLFALNHDHVHGSLRRDSKLAQWIFSAYGMLVMTPRPVWKETHNFHHINNGKIDFTAIGSYYVMTVEQFEAATPAERRAYLWSRHPLTILLGYFSVAVFGMCIKAFVRMPRRHWRGPVAIVLHVALTVALAHVVGWRGAVLSWVLPIAVTHAIAAYLFYAQHNFPDTRFFVRGKWSYTDAALLGSSYMPMIRPMRWLCADIGYHHVHHLNAKIPFYRLAEAMAALPELQDPHTTSWLPWDVWACLKLKTWNPEAMRMEPAPACDPE